LFLHDNVPAHRALANQKKLGWASNVFSPTLFSGSGPVGLPPLPWTEKKNNWKIPIFRPTRRSLLLRRPDWTDIMNFFEWLAKFRATG
jgi:hypothetical protein